VVLPQLLRDHYLHLQQLAVVLVVAAFALASSFLAELHLLRFLFFLLSAARTGVRTTLAAFRVFPLLLYGVNAIQVAFDGEAFLTIHSFLFLTVDLAFRFLFLFCLD
jgi:hypothetical protein